MTSPLRVGRMVTVGEGRSLWVVRSFFLKANLGEWVELEPLSGGCKMTARVSDLRVNGEPVR